jgi:hypothetical protein
MSTINTSDTLKMVREALCVAASSPLVQAAGSPGAYTGVLQRLIDDIDRQRPLGPDGTHGDRHTATCGCIDVAGLPRVEKGDPITVWRGGEVIRFGIIADVRPGQSGGVTVELDPASETDERTKP